MFRFLAITMIVLIHVVGGKLIAWTAEERRIRNGAYAMAMLLAGVDV